MSREYQAWFECECGKIGPLRTTPFPDNFTTITAVNARASKDGADHYNSIPTPDSPEKRQKHQCHIRNQTIN